MASRRKSSTPRPDSPHPCAFKNNRAQYQLSLNPRESDNMVAHCNGQTSESPKTPNPPCPSPPKPPNPPHPPKPPKSSKISTPSSSSKPTRNLHGTLDHGGHHREELPPHLHDSGVDRRKAERGGNYQQSAKTSRAESIATQAHQPLSALSLPPVSTQEPAVGKVRPKASGETIYTLRIREKMEVPHPTPTHVSKKHERVLGIGMEYPETLLNHPGSSHTSTETPHASREVLVSYIAAITVEDDPPSPEPKNPEGKFEYLSNMISKLPKLRKKPEPRELHIEHVTFNAARESFRNIANSTNPERRIRAALPRALRKYELGLAVREGGVFEPEYLPPELQAQSSRSRANSNENKSSNSGGTNSTHSRGSGIPGPSNPPFARNRMHGHSSDQIRVSSNSSGGRRGSASRGITGNAKADHQFWLKQITENDISYPTHAELRNVLPDAVYIRPGWLAREVHPGPDPYAKARNDELRRIAKLINQPGLLDEITERERMDTDSYGGDSSDDIEEYPQEDLRSESGYSDDGQGQPKHTWRQPLLWGTKKMKDLITLRNQVPQEASDSNSVSTYTSEKKKSKKFKIFGRGLWNRPRLSKMASLSNVSLMGSAESVAPEVPFIDPQEYDEPHPGVRVDKPYVW